MKSAGSTERIAVLAALIAIFAAGYFGIGSHVDPERARSLHTALDDRIPLVPAAIYLYTVIYTAFALPLFVIRSPGLFRRVAAAYALVIFACLVVFAAFPVSADGLRGDPALLDTNDFASWGLRLTYFLDPPVNLFPSLHLAIATLAGLSVYTARPAWGGVALAGVALVAFAVCATKQHFAVDAVAGLGMALGAWAAVVRSYRPFPGERLAYDGRGPACYLALHAAFVGVAYTGFRAGFAPWQ